MAKKAKKVKKTNKRTRKVGRQRARKAVNSLTSKQLHSRVSSLLSRPALEGDTADGLAAETMAIATVAPEAVKPVSFTCSNIGSLVRITSGNIHFVFSGTGGANFPVGVSRIFFAVQGPRNQAFSITSQGATLDFPIADRLNARGVGGGRRHITVTA